MDKNRVLAGEHLFDTERLTVRQLTLNDRQFMFDLLNSDGFKQNIADREIDTLDKAEGEILQRYTLQYPKLGFFVVTKQDDGTAIGGVTLIQRDYLDVPDIGYAFLEKFGGQGYALEASRGLLQWAIDQKVYQKLCAITLPSNHRSINLLNKLGFEFIDVRPLGEPPIPESYFEYAVKSRV